MDDITLVRQLLDAVSQIKAWVQGWVSDLVFSVSGVLSDAIGQLDAKKVDKTTYNTFVSNTTTTLSANTTQIESNKANITTNTTGIASNKAAIALLNESLYGSINANPWELYFADLASIVYDTGSFVYNDEYQQLEC